LATFATAASEVDSASVSPWLIICSVVISSLTLCFTRRTNARTSMNCDICIYGGTAAGVIAAVAAAKAGRSVILIEQGRHLGGMTSGGLGFTDIGNKLAIGGPPRHF